MHCISRHVMYICILIEWGGFEAVIWVCGLCWSFSVPWNLIRSLPLTVRAGCQGSAPQLRPGAVGECGHFPWNFPHSSAPEILPLWGRGGPVPWGLGCSLTLPWAHCHFFCDCSIPYMLLFNATQYWPIYHFLPLFLSPLNQTFIWWIQLRL